MLECCYYDKVKVLQILSSIVWYLERHAEPNAKCEGELKNAKYWLKLKKDLEKHIEEIEKLVKKG